MPIYPFKCLKCGKEFDEIHSMKDAPLKVKCECGQIAYRNWNAYGKVNSQMQENHRWSWSMGVNVDKIPEMKKKYPDREYHPKTGQLLVRSRQHKKQLMKEHGVEEYG